VTLDRDQIRAGQAERSKALPFYVEEWGGDVFIRPLTVAEQGALAEASPTQMPVRVILACVTDETGKPMFLDEDAGWLADEPFPVILKVFAQAAKLNGLSTAELDEAMRSFGATRDEGRSSD
jgi:hypothetical protein